MIHRLTSLPVGEEAFRDELNRIKTSARRNGIHLNIESMTRKKVVAKTLGKLTSLPKPEKSQRESWIRLPYLGKFSSGLSKLLRGHNLKVGYYKYRTLGSLFASPEDPIPTLSRSGVYKLSCPNCPAFYMGKTGRTFTKRFNEHADSFRKGKRDSAFAEHLLDACHNFCFDLCQPIHFEEDYRRGRVLEDLEIYRHKEKHGEFVLNRFVNKYGLVPSY